MLWASILVCPITLFSFHNLMKGKIWQAQAGLILAVAIFAAPTHEVMNYFFPPHLRGRNIGFLFMSGLSFGGMFPSVASYMVDKTKYDMAPAIMVSLIALLTAASFYGYKKITTNNSTLKYNILRHN
jgi:hypothetical protein